MKKLKTLLFIVTICTSLSFTSFAHSGRTDSSGGHHDYKNQSGLGSYHYHCGGNPPHLHSGGVCPYDDGGSNSNNNYSSYIPETPSIKVNNAPDTLGIGDRLKLDYSWNNTLKDSRKIISSNEQVIKVVDEDILEAISEGEAIITVRTNNAETSFNIKVKPIMATSIEISNLTNELQLNTNFQFKYSVKPDNTTDKTVTWKSSNPDIATIDAKSGKIKAENVGNTIITCVTSNGIQKDIPIKVYEVFPQEIQTHLDVLNKDTIDLECTKTYHLKITILPENANNKKYNIIIDDNNIAKVTDDDNIVGISDGNTALTIATHNGISKKFCIHVFHTPITNIQLNESSIKSIISIDDIMVIDKNILLNPTFNITPNDATYTKVSWDTSNEQIVEIENSELHIMSTGMVELTAHTYDGQSITIKLYIINTIAIVAVILICLILGLIYYIILRKIKKDIININFSHI